MTTQEVPAAPVEAPGWDELLAAAVATLTAAARLTRPVLVENPDPAGDPRWIPGLETEPADWAEFVTLALAGAAANVGGVENVLAGRPGSWEADGVRNLLHATVGHDLQSLPEYRTEPLVVHVFTDALIVDVGLWRAYDAADAVLMQREEEQGGPTFLTGEPRTRVWTAEEDAAVDAINELRDRLDELRAADEQAWMVAFRAEVQRRATALGYRVPVRVVEHDGYGPTPGAGPANDWTVETLVEDSMQATPLPGGGVDLLQRVAEAEEKGVGQPRGELPDA